MNDVSYPGRHFHLAVDSAESAAALANVGAEAIETSAAVLARFRQAIIDLLFAPLTLKSITEQKKIDLIDWKCETFEKWSTYPVDWQLHVKLLIPSIHVPPFKQDVGRQSLTFSAHLGPVKPGRQVHIISSLD